MRDETVPGDDGANPLLSRWTAPFGAPPFDQVKAADFLPALRAGIAEQQREIEAIKAAAPGFETSLAALERSGLALSRVRRLFWMLSSAQADPGIRAIEAEVSALLTAHASAIGHDSGLFAHIAAVWESREGLDEEQRRLVEESYRGFEQGGALLGAADKARFAQIDQKLAGLSVRFGQNVLAAAAAWEMLLDAPDLDGLPDDMRAAAAERSATSGNPGLYAFKLDRGEVEAFLAFSTRRDLRERIWRAFTGRCDGGANDNRPVLAEIIALRSEQARLLGRRRYADLALEGSMAATPQAAAALMARVWAPARIRAVAEAAELQQLMDSHGARATLEPWDWRFHAEHIRRDRFALDGAAVKRHLRLDSVRGAAFAAAQRLFGLRFTPQGDVPLYHSDVRAWAVEDASGAPVGLLYTDYFARAQKHGGAWMGSLRVQEKIDAPVLPIVYTVANFVRAPRPEETCVSLDEARTLFHEFGHALHALLSDVTFPSLAGTSVPRDFVEFPSKLMEHWIAAPEALRGLGMPEPLVEAIGRADSFGQGFATVEFLASAIVDLAIHESADPGADPNRIEAETLARIDMPPQIAMRHRLPHFTHIFDGGYGSVYYSYLWSEMLDADAFEAFAQASERRGDLFDPQLAGRYRREVLARGNARDPMASFIAFRGRAPDEAALLRSRHLA